MNRNEYLYWASLGVFAFQCTVSTLQASPPIVVQALPTGSSNLTNLGFGKSVAISPKYLVVGSPGDDTGGNNAGAIQIHNVRTGALIRKVLGDSPEANEEFGFSVAISGNRILVGAPGGGGGRGICYLIDASTGKQVAGFFTAVAPNGARLGESVALVGDMGVLGAPGTQGGGLNGQAFVVDLRTGSFDTDLLAQDGAANDRFGKSVATNGNLVVVGAPGDNASAGSIYIFDPKTGVLMSKAVPLDPGVGKDFGVSVAMSGELTLVGSPAVTSSGAAAVYVMEAISGQQLTKIAAPFALPGFGRSVATSGSLGLVGNGDSGDAYLVNLPFGDIQATIKGGNHPFGAAVAICGNMGAVGSDQADTLASNSGAAYVVSPIAGKEPTVELLRKGGVVGNVPGRLANTNKQIGVLADSVLSGGITSTTGSGSNGGKAVVFHLFGTPLAETGADTFLGYTFGTPLRMLLAQNPNRWALWTTLSGTGVNSSNNEAILNVEIGGFGQVLRKGDNVPGPGSGIISGFKDVRQSRTGGGSLAISINLKVGALGVNAASDSAVVLMNGAGAFSNIDTEGGPQPFGGGLMGQMTGRVSMPGESVAYTAAIQSSPIDNQGLFRHLAGGALVPVRRKNDGTGIANISYSTFLGETITTDNSIVFRTTHTVSSATAANKEGIWMVDGAGNSFLLALKGDTYPPLGALIKWKSFQRFMPAGPNQVLILGQISGPNVNASSDTVLALRQADGTMLQLMREGDTVPGCDGARVGVFQVVDASIANGTYVLLTSLTGAASDSNQALFLGSATNGNVGSRSSLRLPLMKLRKGQQINDDAGSASKITSIAMPAPISDASGAGGKGGTQLVTDFGQTTMVLTYSDGYQQLVVAEWPTP